MKRINEVKLNINNVYTTLKRMHLIFGHSSCSFNKNFMKPINLEIAQTVNSKMFEHYIVCIAIYAILIII